MTPRRPAEPWVDFRRVVVVARGEAVRDRYAGAESKAGEILRRAAHLGRRVLIHALIEARKDLTQRPTAAELADATLAQQGVRPDDPYRTKLAARLIEVAHMRAGELRLADPRADHVGDLTWGGDEK